MSQPRRSMAFPTRKLSLRPTLCGPMAPHELQRRNAGHPQEAPSLPLFPNRSDDLHPRRLKYSQAPHQPHERTRPFKFALAFKIVTVKTHEDTITNIRQPTACDPIAAIKTSLSTGSGDDGDIVITSSNMIISTFDRIDCDRLVQNPVRGLNCLPRACFDFDPFISTAKQEQLNCPLWSIAGAVRFAVAMCGLKL